MILKFTWFGLISLHPQVEAIPKKFTIKRWNTKSSMEKTLKTQHSKTPKSHSHTKEDKREISLILIAFRHSFNWDEFAWCPFLTLSNEGKNLKLRKECSYFSPSSTVAWCPIIEVEVGRNRSPNLSRIRSQSRSKREDQFQLVVVALCHIKLVEDKILKHLC